VRQLNPSTNLVLTVLAGLGLLASLSLPWFAAPAADPTSTDGQIERGAYQLGKVFATDAQGAVSGTDALGGARVAIVALVGALALVALAVSAPAMRRQAEDLMRLLVIAAPIVVIAAAVTHPGTTTPVNIHYGMLVSFVLVAFMASAAWHGANMRAKKAAPVRPRYGPAR
jgi:hypothetical protein